MFLITLKSLIFIFFIHQAFFKLLLNIKLNKMYKRPLTIQTQSYKQDEIDQTLNKYIDQIGQNNSNDSFKQASFRTKEKQTSFKNSFQNISHSDYQKYQFIPENQYSQSSNINREIPIRPQSKASRQLKGANQIQKLLSQAMANLFISCWESLKDLLLNYNQTKIKNSSQINIYQAENQFGAKSQKSVENLSNTQKRKIQIMERQRKGITLDSLQKKRNTKSKSIKKQQITFNQSQNRVSNENQVNIVEAAQKDLTKSNNSGASKKSYRQKFNEYKHEEQLNGGEIIQNSYKKSATYSNLQSFKPKQQNNSYIHYNRMISINNNNNNTHHIHKKQLQTTRYNLQRQRQLQHATDYQGQASYKSGSYYDQKNQLLNNINKMLQNKDEKQTKSYNYQSNRTINKNLNHAVDYMDNVNTIHQNNINTLRNLSHSFQPNNTQVINHEHQQYVRFYHPLSKTELHVNHDQQEFARARLLEQIVDKLHYSKLKYVNQGQKQSNQDAQMVKKLGRLQRLVLELKVQNQKASRVKSEYQQKESRPKRQYQSQYISRQEDQLFRKFTDQLSIIRNQLSQLKNSRPASRNNGNQQMIIEQQRLLNSFQQSLTRLQRIQQSNRQSQIQIQRPTFIEQPKTSNPQSQGSGSFLAGLIEANKNKSDKQGWQKGWEQTEKVTNINSLSRRQIELKGRDNLTNYRYTRNQILNEIGRKQQIQEQQRRLHQYQQRVRLQKQGTSTRVIRKVQDDDEELMIKKRPIRQTYQKQWSQYQKNKIDIDYNNNCCSLFPC